MEEKIATQISLTANKLEEYQSKNWSICVSSSFQTHSIPLLHLLTTLDHDIKVYFLDTGFHFPETLSFRDEVADFLGIEVENISSHLPKTQQMDASGKFLFVNDPDRCCFINKVQPMDFITARHKVWVSGVRRDQSAVRKNFQLEVAAPNGSIRFHPMLDWDNRMIFHYIRQHNLPRHPLDAKGYQSIGCAPCTSRPEDDLRSGRWAGLNKTECGLHTELVG